MAVLGVLIVGMSVVFAGGAFASAGSHTTTSSTTHEHQAANDPAGPAHAGNQVGATGEDGVPDHAENGSASTEDGTESATDPAGDEHAGHHDNGTAEGGDSGTDTPDNPAETGSEN